MISSAFLKIMTSRFALMHYPIYNVDMVNAHYVIIDFRAKFFSKIQNQASDTSRSLPSFSSAPFLLRVVPSERLGQVYVESCY
jgi:hypothetical protein